MSLWHLYFSLPATMLQESDNALLSVLGMPDPLSALSFNMLHMSTDQTEGSGPVNMRLPDKCTSRKVASGVIVIDVTTRLHELV